ncbi:hypothetical protein BHM03_00039582, partial [Ensete ventricosum]
GCHSPLLLPSLRRHRYPCAGDGCPCPPTTAPTAGAAAHCGLAAGDRPLWGVYHHYRLVVASRPFASGQAVVDRPCRGPGRGQPPLQMAWPWLAAPFPCCPLPSSSSIAASPATHPHHCPLLQPSMSPTTALYPPCYSHCYAAAPLSTAVALTSLPQPSPLPTVVVLPSRCSLLQPHSYRRHCPILSLSRCFPLRFHSHFCRYHHIPFLAIPRFHRCPLPLQPHQIQCY